MKQSSQTSLMHEKMAVGICLALAGGFLDAYTYLLRGGVFANAQTGNIVLFGIHLAKQEWLNALYCFVPILAFFLGVLMTEFIKLKCTAREMITEHHVVLAVEAVFLFVIGWLPENVPDSFVNVSISFVCSLQVNSFRKIAEVPCATTMCTGNLRSTAEQFFRLVAFGEREAGVKCLRYVGIILAFTVGAGGGALLARQYGGRSIWICSGLFLAVLCLLLWDSRRRRTELSLSGQYNDGK